MPPKKKKLATVVVGTVSTRSTRRESVVNIEIKPKITRGSAKSLKKQTRVTGKSPEKINVEVESGAQARDTKSQGADILELLKDWSDDDNSLDTNILSSSRRQEETVESFTSNDIIVHHTDSLRDDQQSLIDILEGKQSDSETADDFAVSKSKPAVELIENPIVNVDSPQNEEQEIIEECVVEDNSIIIELPEQAVEEESCEVQEEGRITVNLGENEEVVSQSLEFDGSTVVETESCAKEAEEILVESQEEKSLCERISETMQISSEAAQVADQDVASDKLEESLKNISLKEDDQNVGEETKIEKTAECEIDREGDISPRQIRRSTRKKQVDNETDPDKDSSVNNLETELSAEQPTSTGVKMEVDDLQEKADSPKKPQSIKETPAMEVDSTSEENKPPLKSSKAKPKKTTLDKSLEANIDATIDEVLRKYTQEKKPSKKKSKETKQKKEETSEERRRSDRIKTIVPIKKKSHGLVRSKSEPLLNGEIENSDSNSAHSEMDKATPTGSPQLTKKDKTKSKSKSSEALSSLPKSESAFSEISTELPKAIDMNADKAGQAEIEARLKSFLHLKENQYKTDRQLCKEAREMVCDCYLAEEDIRRDEYGCGDDCLNRLLMIECGELCQVGDRCTNKRFQKNLFAPVEVFKTEKKGLGLRAAANIPYGEFILEYVGEVLNSDEFDKRAEVYSKDKNIHFYFMSLRSDAIIDATMKGNISRFINHSCDPNAETQKWTVNGELRIGFFSTRTILAGEEITFDYRFQRYGKEAQKCYCEAATCRGWLGERPGDSEDEEDEEEEEEESPKEALDQMNEAQVAAKDKNKTEVQTNLSLENVDTKAVADKIGDATTPQIKEPRKKPAKKKLRKETLLFEDFDQLNEDIDMLVTTGLKNQSHTLKLSRLMVRAKELEQRKKLLRVLRRGELPCRRLFLDYHGLRLMHGYMVDAGQLTASSPIEFLQTKLELLQTLAVLPIQNKTMLIESKVLPAVEKWANNEELVEEEGLAGEAPNPDPSFKEKVDEIRFLANKLMEEWANLKEIFRIPKKQRIEQMKEHEKEANRKFMESSYAQEKESSRKNDQRYRTWSRNRSERETNKKGGHRSEDKDKPSAEFLKISKHERRKLFALQMELKEEERRMKQREMWRQHEMNCMMIGADPRFTAPFDPSKGFQYIWNPTIGQWQALPVPSAPEQRGSFNSPAASQHTHHQPLLGSYPPAMLGAMSSTPQYPGIQPPNVAPMVPGLPTNVPPLNTSTGQPMAPNIPGITQPPLPAGLPIYPNLKQVEEDPSQVKFAGPIPPPAKLPPKWKCAKDKYGRPYYYHVKIRKSQWEPPPLPEETEESSETSSSDTSSMSSSDSSSEYDTEDEIDDTKLLMEVRKQMERTSSKASVKPVYIKKEEKDSATPSPEVKVESEEEVEPLDTVKEPSGEPLSSIDIRLKEQFNLDSPEMPRKKRRVGLCQEIIISPRTEEDRLQSKEDLKRFKANKEKLKRQKEQLQQQTKKKAKLVEDAKKPKDKRLPKNTAKLRIKEMNEFNTEHAKKIKEVFRSTMATTVVGVLNAYRKPDCKEARITNTEDFKHLARKLTHFVMLKEMKHITKIEELVCTDNVKAKAREYIKKYMSKFGQVYQKRQDEPDFRD